MKKLFSVLIITMILIAATVSAFAVEVNIDGNFVQFNNNMGYPFIDSHNRTQVPLRATMEAAGCSVSWEADTRTAVVKRGKTTVRVPIGQSYILVNGKTVWNDTSALIKNSRTYLPIRVVLEAFGMDVNWNSWEKWVVVNVNGCYYPDEILEAIMDTVPGDYYNASNNRTKLGLTYVGNGWFNVTYKDDPFYVAEAKAYYYRDYRFVARYDMNKGVFLLKNGYGDIYARSALGNQSFQKAGYAKNINGQITFDLDSVYVHVELDSNYDIINL